MALALLRSKVTSCPKTLLESTQVSKLIYGGRSIHLSQSVLKKGGDKKEPFDNLVKAAKNVASKFGKEQPKIEKDLMGQLEKHTSKPLDKVDTSKSPQAPLKRSKAASKPDQNFVKKETFIDRIIKASKSREGQEPMEENKIPSLELEEPQVRKRPFQPMQRQRDTESQVRKREPQQMKRQRDRESQVRNWQTQQMQRQRDIPSMQTQGLAEPVRKRGNAQNGSIMTNLYTGKLEDQDFEFIESSIQNTEESNQQKDQQLRKVGEKRKQSEPLPFDLYSERPLGIFFPKDVKKQSKDDLTFHEILELETKEKVRSRENIIPYNGFEEMILQTLEGKLWRYPIDNEQDWKEEEDVPFHEHVFLEDAIADFPKQGPLRSFMELVILGLSQNPHLSVKEKHEHINWYREYFKQPEKQKVLVESLGDNARFSELEQLTDS